MTLDRPRQRLTLADLGMGDRPITASVWLVDVGDPVTEGDRLLEVSVGSATIDLPSPASGVLVSQLVDEGQRVTVGQVLGVIEEGE